VPPEPGTDPIAETRATVEDPASAPAAEVADTVETVETAESDDPAETSNTRLAPPPSFGPPAPEVEAPEVEAPAPPPLAASSGEQTQDDVLAAGPEDPGSGTFELLRVQTARPGFELVDSSAHPPAAEQRPLYRADPDRILRVLAANQFEDPFLAFRELYANALDAVRGRLDPKIELKVAVDKVVVEDNGTGLDPEGLAALTTLGSSTRRSEDAIGRFGIGFASVFDPSLGIKRVDFIAARARAGAESAGIRVRFSPDVSGGVSIQVEDMPGPRAGGSRVELTFDPARAPTDRVARTMEVFETHAAYSGVETILNGRMLGKDLADYIKGEVNRGTFSAAERALIASSAVRGPVGVAAIDPSRGESRFRAYQRGLFVCEMPLQRPSGRPWPRGVFGAVHGEGLDLVASRNAFVENDRFERLREELRRLAYEAAYRVVRYYESSQDAYARIVLLDSLRRGLKTTTPEGLLAESDDLFSSAVVRSPLFRSWGSSKRFSFEELVAMKRAERFRALAYRPASRDLEEGPIMRADDSIERDIFRKLSGMREMPAAARAEAVSRPSIFSRALDRLLSGPRAEYSLFQRQVSEESVEVGIQRIVHALQRFLASEEVAHALGRLLPGPLPNLGFGVSRNAFGPVAAYRLGEIRFNARHRTLRRLAKEPDPELAGRALLPVLAHELAHVCHELHDLDFYRTSRALLRALVVAAAQIDARRVTSEVQDGPAAD
jgi:hypothetical protein